MGPQIHTEESPTCRENAEGLEYMRMFSMRRGPWIDSTEMERGGSSGLCHPFLPPLLWPSYS